MPSKSKYRQVKESDLKGAVRTVYDSPQPTAVQLARRDKSISAVKALGLPYMEKLPVIEDDAQVTNRTPREVAQRCVAVAICAVKGETQGQDQALVDSLMTRLSAAENFSPVEARFIRNKQPTTQECIDFCWQYECVHVFLWALGHVKQLNPPDKVCDAEKNAEIMLRGDAAGFVTKAELRSKSEILDMADLYYRLHWAAIELRLKGQTSDKLDEGIIRERHRALNWLIRYMNQEWDNVSTDT